MNDSQKTKKAPYIVIDGLDGCGKGKQIMLFHNRATEEGREFAYTVEPGGGQMAREIRTLFKSDLGMRSSSATQFLLMWAARRCTIEEDVWPNLEKGIPVISDRGDSSTLAYQVYANQAHELEDEFWRMRKLVFEKHEPSMYVIVDVPPEVARARSLADNSHNSQFDLAPLDFYERVHKGFRALAKKLPNNVIFVDGNRSPEDVQKDFYQVISKVCGWE